MSLDQKRKRARNYFVIALVLDFLVSSVWLDGYSDQAILHYGFYLSIVTLVALIACSTLWGVLLDKGTGNFAFSFLLGLFTIRNLFQLYIRFSQYQMFQSLTS